jgi:hypothetical protein
METEILQIDAAVEQLDWAIRLFLDHQAYRPAITLASAAEDILGKKTIGDRAAHPQLKSKLPLKYATDPEKVSDEHLNRVRIWLKHAAPQEPKLCWDWEEDAIQQINRALSNFAVYVSNPAVYDCERLPEAFPRFLAWQRDRASSDAA